MTTTGKHDRKRAFFIIGLAIMIFTIYYADRVNFGGGLRGAEEDLKYTLRIAVFGYNRYESLEELWYSIRSAQYHPSTMKNVRIDIEIHLDAHKEGKYNHTLQLLHDRFVERLHWPYGSFKVFRKTKNIGLKNSILSAWYPTRKNEFMLFLEDDVELSPFWFTWFHRTLLKYYNFQNPQKNLLGISLYNQQYTQVQWKFLTIETNNKPYLCEIPVSWGGVYFPLAWKRFLHWNRAIANGVRKEDITIPKSQSNDWPSESSWKKFLMYYNYKNHNYIIYPNFPKKLSLSTNKCLPGVHSKGGYREYLHLPLVNDALDFSVNGFDPFDFPRYNQLQVFDIYGEEVKK